MEQIYDYGNGSKFRKEMLKLSRNGRKSEAMTLIQSRIDEISSRSFLSKSGRRKRTKLLNVLLEIKTEEAFEIHSRSRHHVFDGPIQTENGVVSEGSPIKNNFSDIHLVTQTVLPSVAPPISGFLSCLKSYLDLVETIGKKAVLALLEQKIHYVKMDKAVGYELELTRYKKIFNIISSEEKDVQNIKKKKTVPKKKTPTLSKNRQKVALKTERGMEEISTVIPPGVPKIKREPYSYYHSKNKWQKKKTFGSRQNGALKFEQGMVGISNVQAPVISAAVPKIKTEPTTSTWQNKVKIEKPTTYPDRISVKQEVIEVD